MWQPSARQWTVIWPVALLVVLAWPPDRGRSLGIKIVNWAADPAASLPAAPPPLPMGLDDDGDAVTEHDMLETAYLRGRERSVLTRLRLDARDGGDPLDPSTERQILVGLVVVASLAVWRMHAARRVS